jgi:hypothetical protein
MARKIWDDFEEIGAALKVAEEGFWLIVMMAVITIGVWWVWL